MCIYLHSELPRAEKTVSSWIMAAFFMLGSCFYLWRWVISCLRILKSQQHNNIPVGVSNVPCLTLTIAPRPILMLKALSAGEHGQPFSSFGSKLWSHSGMALRTFHGQMYVSIFHHAVLLGDTWAACGVCRRAQGNGQWALIHQKSASLLENALENV